MGVLGFSFSSINAHVDEKNLFGSVSVTSTPTIDGVEKKDFGDTGMKEVIGVRFRYVTSYDKAGEIAISGEVLYQVDDAKKTEKMWKDNKKMDDAVAVEILNFVLRRCIAKTVEISDDLRLPPPVQFPVVTNEKSDVKGKGK